MTKQARTLTSIFEGPRFSWLDRAADVMQPVFQKSFSTPTGEIVKSWLNGAPIRHRVHPALIIAPLGAWSTAVVLDVLDLLDSRSNSDGYRRGADAAVGMGVVTAVPTALAGISDWVDLWGHQRRVATLHALVNLGAHSLFAASWGARAAGLRGAGRALSGVGYAAVLFSGALGGDLVYNLGTNVSKNDFPQPSEDEVDVLASADLPDGVPVVVEVGPVPVMLLRHGSGLYAVQNWCTHAGGPLNEGDLEGTCVTCPWHGSQFDLSNGAPLVGPAASPLHTFAVRELGGRIYVRPSYEGQDWPQAPEVDVAASAR